MMADSRSKERVTTRMPRSWFCSRWAIFTIRFASRLLDNTSESLSDRFVVELSSSSMLLEVSAHSELSDMEGSKDDPSSWQSLPLPPLNNISLAFPSGILGRVRSVITETIFVAAGDDGSGGLYAGPVAIVVTIVVTVTVTVTVAATVTIAVAVSVTVTTVACFCRKDPIRSDLMLL